MKPNSRPVNRMRVLLNDIGGVQLQMDETKEYNLKQNKEDLVLWICVMMEHL